MVVNKKDKNQSIAGGLVFVEERPGSWSLIIFYISHFALLLPINFNMIV